MPLLDHFHLPLERRSWQAFHSAWASNIAFHLNRGLLPEEYYAQPQVEVAGRVEVDVATFRDAEPGGAVATYAPPPAVLTAPLDEAGIEAYTVTVTHDFGGPQLRACIELVSPANKDRPAARRAFAAKCANHLRRGVGVIIVDVVTARAADLHVEIASSLDHAEGLDWTSPTKLYAVSYRGLVEDSSPRVEAWPHALAIGEALPELPLWLEPDLCLPLALEESYMITCRTLRIRG